MNVVFRTDASLQIGIGHVMRCLSLAETLKEYGVNIIFICRKHEGNLINKINLNGFSVFELESHKYCKSDNKLPHSHLLGVTQQQDAIECIHTLQETKVDYMIVDHYGIDEEWHKKLKKHCNKLLVIDDLANREYHCDILLDQTFDRQSIDYKGLVPKSCKLLLGSQFSLLSKQFIKWRDYSLERRRHPVFKQLLVHMGGVDFNNITEKILKKLKLCNLPNNINVVVIMGKFAPYLKNIENQVSDLPFNVEIKTDIDNMAEVMAHSDICIGAAGTSTWERCCLGLPTIQIIIADNQKDIAVNLSSVKAVKLISDICQLPKAIKDISKYNHKMSLNSSTIVDGSGSYRVGKLIFEKISYTEQLSIKPANKKDCIFTYSLQTKNIRKYFINTKIPNIDHHINWYKELLESHKSQLLILTFENQRAGVLRIDNLGEEIQEISIIISPKYGNKGIAKQAIKTLERLLPKRIFKATIHTNNTASKKVFIKSGFKVNKQNGDFLEYIKNNQFSTY